MPDISTSIAPIVTADRELLALRAEIDALDDALHDLLMRRVDVVARLAASRAKGDGPALRPGREAAILRRLLARHRGPLPREGLVRLWRELLAATTALQAPMTVSAWLPEEGIEVLRAHLGLAAPVTRCGSAEEALAAGTALVALPPAGRWWLDPIPARLHVTARLPFLGIGPTVLLLSPAPPDASGDDRSLLRMPPAAVPPGATELARAGDFALVELAGEVPSGATVLGAYPAPVTPQVTP